jgi:hypothetical protein
MTRRRSLADRRDADPSTVIAALLDHGVEFVVVGGVAAIAHGVQRTTRDIDFLLRPGKRNSRRAIAALAELGAEELRPRSKRWVRVSAAADPDWLLKEPRFFDSAAGGIDVCNSIPGVPGWKAALAGSLEIEAFGRSFRILDRDTLIRSKLSAGREKDLADVAELGEL